MELVAQFLIWTNSQIWGLALSQRDLSSSSLRSSLCSSDGSLEGKVIFNSIDATLRPWSLPTAERKKTKMNRELGKETFMWQFPLSGTEWWFFLQKGDFKMHLRVKSLRSSEAKMILKVGIIKDRWCNDFGGTRGTLPVVKPNIKISLYLVQAWGTGKLVISEVKNSHCNFKKECPFLINLWKFCTTLSAGLNVESVLRALPPGHIWVNVKENGRDSKLARDKKMVNSRGKNKWRQIKQTFINLRKIIFVANS